MATRDPKQLLDAIDDPELRALMLDLGKNIAKRPCKPFEGARYLGRDYDAKKASGNDS